MSIFYWQGSPGQNRHPDVAEGKSEAQPRRTDWRNDWRVEFALLVVKTVTVFTVVGLAAVIALAPYSAVIKFLHPGGRQTTTISSGAMQRHQADVSSTRTIGNTDRSKMTKS